jgi:aquaporin Z/aquaporin NIP
MGSLFGAVAAVLVANIFRGEATAQEAQAAMGTPLGPEGAIKLS